MKALPLKRTMPIHVKENEMSLVVKPDWVWIRRPFIEAFGRFALPERE